MSMSKADKIAATAFGVVVTALLSWMFVDVIVGKQAGEATRVFLESKGFKTINISGRDEDNCPDLIWRTTSFTASGIEAGDTLFTRTGEPARYADGTPKLFSFALRYRGVVCMDFKGNATIRMLEQ